MPGMWVRSLVRELRSHKPWATKPMCCTQYSQISKTDIENNWVFFRIIKTSTLHSEIGNVNSSGTMNPASHSPGCRDQNLAQSSLPKAPRGWTMSVPLTAATSSSEWTQAYVCLNLPHREQSSCMGTKPAPLFSQITLIKEVFLNRHESLSGHRRVMGVTRNSATS